MGKAIITITPNRFYDKSHKEGAMFTSVDMEGHNYGSASPCDNDEEIISAIKHCKEWATREGQKYEIIDLRPKKPMFVGTGNFVLNIDRTKSQQVLF